MPFIPEKLNAAFSHKKITGIKPLQSPTVKVIEKHFIRLKPSNNENPKAS